MLCVYVPLGALNMQKIHIFPLYFNDLINPCWVTLGSLWPYEGDFGTLWNHFAITLESLWVCQSPFSKNNHFPNRFELFDATLN